MNKQYVVYLQPRTSRHHMLPEDWQNKVRLVPGVRVVDTTPARLQVEADESAIAEVQIRVRAHCVVEEVR